LLYRRHGFLAPQGAFIVEHGYPLLTRDVVWTVPGDRLDEKGSICVSVSKNMVLPTGAELAMARG
jgi:hypothetical protein